MCVGVSLGFLSYSLIYISVFLSVPYHLDYCSFVVKSEVRKIDSSSSILSQGCFDYSRSFAFLRRLLVGFSPWGHKESDTTEQQTSTF